MYSVEDAETVFHYYQEHKLVILGNEVAVNFSRYERLVRPKEQSASQCVLLVSIICCDNSTLPLRLFYTVGYLPISHFQICSRFGCVERIRMFIHQAGPQALVQYTHLYDCIRAKGELEKVTFMLGSHRYAFEVQFSKLKELVIHKNNNYSRDFLLCPLGPCSISDTADPSLLPFSSRSSLQSRDSLSSALSDMESLSSGDSPRLQDHRALCSGAALLRQVAAESVWDASMAMGLEDTHAALLRGGNESVRKYVLVGFARMMPISDLVDLLYGIDIKYAEYQPEHGGYAVVIFGKSEWSDAMLASYLSNNPVDGRVIRLRSASEAVPMWGENGPSETLV